MRFLAKLREFRPGMDVGEYLNTEMRQNLKSLADFSQNSQESLTTLSSNMTVLFANPDETFNNTSGIYSLDNSVVKSGVIKDKFYYPETGAYFVEYNATFVNARANNIPLGTMNVFAISSQTGELFDTRALCSYTIQNNVVINNPGRIGFFADLSPNLGIGFKGESLNSGLEIQNLNIKITKVG